MKTKFLLASAVAATLISCSDDDSTMVNLPIPQAQEFKIVTSSNTSGKVTYSNLLETNPSVKSFTIPSADTDGVFYNSSSDEIILASRSNNVLEVYKGIKNAISSGGTTLNVNYSSTSDFNNPREVAVSGDKVVVTQDQNVANLNTNKLVVYRKTSSGLTLLNSYTVDFKTWGIFLQGTTLYAVADLTGDLVVFENFFTNPNGAITPTKRVTIDGLVRTHGIVFSSKDNTMVLTDVGAAASDSDGGIIVINNFTSVLNNTVNGGIIPMSSQKRIYGASSKLGNPVDVSYDYVTKKIFVAERLNEGGKLLTFNFPMASGDASPIESRMEPGISSVYLIRK
jgi:hypothetical protein